MKAHKLFWIVYCVAAASAWTYSFGCFFSPEITAKYAGEIRERFRSLVEPGSVQQDLWVFLAALLSLYPLCVFAAQLSAKWKAAEEEKARNAKTPDSELVRMVIEKLPGMTLGKSDSTPYLTDYDTTRIILLQPASNSTVKDLLVTIKAMKGWESVLSTLTDKDRNLLNEAVKTDLALREYAEKTAKWVFRQDLIKTWLNENKKGDQTDVG